MRRKAEAKAPSTKYFSAASWLRSRRWRAVAARMYSGREIISRMTNSVMRSLLAPKSIMPPSENRVRGKISVVVHPARMDSLSSALPGRSAAWAAKAPSPTEVRSAITRTASSPMTRRIPWAAMEKGSSVRPADMRAPGRKPLGSWNWGTAAAAAPAALTSPQRRNRETPEARMARKLSVDWMARRAGRAMKASTRTPRTPAPRMMRTGVRASQLTIGAVAEGLTWCSLP